MFAATLAIGVYTAMAYAAGRAVDLPSPIPPGGFTQADAIIIGVMVLSLLLIMKSRRASAFFLWAFLIILIFSGTQLVLGALVSPPWDLFGALLAVVLVIAVHNVLSHNLGIILGIAGVGAALGLTITPQLGLVLLVVFSLYDILAVYYTKHMVAMANRMIEGGAIFGYLIPFSWKGFLAGRDSARRDLGQNFMILGSGDIGLPLIFACSLATTSLAASITAAAFSVIGLFLTHLIFLNQRTKRAMAALPPIATMTIIGYLVSFLFI